MCFHLLHFRKHHLGACIVVCNSVCIGDCNGAGADFFPVCNRKHPKQSKASQAIESIRLLRYGPNRSPRTGAPREIISKAHKMSILITKDDTQHGIKRFKSEF